MHRLYTVPNFLYCTSKITNDFEQHKPSKIRITSAKCQRELPVHCGTILRLTTILFMVIYLFHSLRFSKSICGECGLRMLQMRFITALGHRQNTFLVIAVRIPLSCSLCYLDLTKPCVSTDRWVLTWTSLNMWMGNRKLSNSLLECNRYIHLPIEILFIDFTHFIDKSCTESVYVSN